MTKKYSLNRHAAVLSFLLLLTLTFFVGLPMLSTTRILAENRLEKISRHVNTELSRSVFSMMYIDNYAKNWEDGNLVTNLLNFASSSKEISSLIIIHNDQIIGEMIKGNTPSLVENPTTAFNTMKHLEAGPFYRDLEGSVYLQIVINHFLKDEGHYQFVLFVKSPFLQNIIESNKLNGSYLFLQVERGSGIAVLPLFKIENNEKNNSEIVTLAWANRNNNEAIFSHFYYKGSRYLSWINPLLSIGQEATIGLVLPQKIVSQPLQKIVWPFALILLVTTSVYTIIILGVFLKVKNSYTSLEDLLSQGENEKTEFKSSLRWDYKEGKANVKVLESVIMKSIAAFSNGYGGTILIGVDDQGSILGLQPDYETLKKDGQDFYELHLRSLISSTYGETFCIRQTSISFFKNNGKDICSIRIKRGLKPIYSNIGGKEAFYTRSGNSSRMIEKPSELTSYIRGRFH